MYNINNLVVHEFCSLLSDAHSPVALSLSFNNLGHKYFNLTKIQEEKIRLWDASNVDSFRANLQMTDFDPIYLSFNQIEAQQHITSNDVNSLVNNINECFLKCAEKSFGKIKYTDIKSSKTPSWHGPECKTKRKNWHRAKHRYKIQKSQENKVELKVASKAYKNIMKKHYRKFKKFNVNRLRSLKTSNPKQYWQIINGKKSESTQASLSNLFQYFKKVNAGPEQAADDNGDLEDHDENEENFFINCPFTYEELLKAVTSLKNNKACGVDSVLNEHIKSSFNDMWPIYLRLFNIILEYGIVPDCWTLGVIKPINKHKGSKDDPSNYRPITLVSCIGKFFTTVLSARLNKFAEHKDIINNTQTGFRKGFSTIDNMFVLYSLIELLNSKKKKLFCAFIDLKQAFDTIWRDGLWQKLPQFNINGKCYRLIKNMYDNIKSSVMVDGGVSNYFSCNIGLRQGENLSPFLFNIYLNDLETYFFRHDTTSGIECESSELDHTVTVYLKLFILLYADGTVIFSESKEGLQAALNAYSNYCNEWRLSINVENRK